MEDIGFAIKFWLFLAIEIFAGGVLLGVVVLSVREIARAVSRRRAAAKAAEAAKAAQAARRPRPV